MSKILLKLLISGQDESLKINEKAKLYFHVEGGNHEYFRVMSIYLKDIISIVEYNQKRIIPRYLTTRLKRFLEKQTLSRLQRANTTHRRS